MKNLFKKSIKKEVKSNIQKLEKNQLGKVIGGADGINSTNSSMPNRISMNVTVAK